MKLLFRTLRLQSKQIVPSATTRSKIPNSSSLVTRVSKMSGDLFAVSLGLVSPNERQFNAIFHSHQFWYPMCREFGRYPCTYAESRSVNESFEIPVKKSVLCYGYLLSTGSYGKPPWALVLHEVPDNRTLVFWWQNLLSGYKHVDAIQTIPYILTRSM